MGTPFQSKPPTEKPLLHEPEHQGSVWTHPYMIYIVLTAVLFLFIVGMGILAVKQGWIPNRGFNGTEG